MEGKQGSHVPRRERKWVMENTSQIDLLFQNMEIAPVVGRILAISLYILLFGFVDLFIRKHHPAKDNKKKQKNILRQS